MRLGPLSVRGSFGGCFSGGERRKASFSAPRKSLPTDMDEAGAFAGRRSRSLAQRSFQEPLGNMLSFSKKNFGAK